MSSRFSHFPLHQQPSCRPPVNPHTSLTQTPTLAAGNAIDTVLTVGMQREGKKSKVVVSPTWKSTYFPSSEEFTAYEKYTCWQTRSGNPFIDYFTLVFNGKRGHMESCPLLSSFIHSPEPKGARVAASTSEIPPPSLPSADQQSWDFSDEPIPSRNPQTSTSQHPHTSTSANNDTHAEPLSEPRGCLLQRPNAEQTQPAPQWQSSPVWHPGHHPPCRMLSPETTQTAPQPQSSPVWHPGRLPRKVLPSRH